MDKKMGKSSKNYLKIIISLIICIVVMFSIVRLFSLTGSNQTEEPMADSSSEVSAICELATVRAYYHNVAAFEKQPSGLFRHGYKKMWMEYSGIIEMGINANGVKVSEPDEKGIVEVYVPDAKVLSVDSDINTLTAPLVETGVFTKISAEDKAKAFSVAQTTMEEEARTDKNLLSQAKGRAKELLKEYILNTGRQLDAKYTIKWVNK